MKKVHGNAWSTSHCNRLVAERMEIRQHERHIRALETTRGMVDAKAPPDMPHLRNKLKTRKLQEDRASEIQLENRILLQKMLNIDTKPTDLSPDVLTSNRAAPRSLNGGAQRKELDRITGSNMELLRRLQGIQPSVDPRKWEDDEMDRQALKYRLSQNSCRGRVANLRLPDRVVSDRLPRIAGSSLNFHENEWAEITNQELDRRLREAEGRYPPALTGN